MNTLQYGKLINKITDEKSLTDLYKIAKNINALIYESDLGKDGGLYFYKLRTKIILLNINLSYYHKCIVLAHEIAHATLHPYTEACFTRLEIPQAAKKEKDANYFACKLLEAIGFWENDQLCVYEDELTKSDIKFIESYKCYLK